MRYVGKITTWKDDKGFGFITIKGTQNQVFLHINNFQNRSRRPIEGDTLTFEVKLDGQDRPSAINVSFEREQKSSYVFRSAVANFNQIFAAAFFIMLFALFFIGKIPLSVIGVYLILSVITFMTYAIDKYAAKKNQRRTPEDTLHTMSFMGGWLGAAFAQHLFRHKSKKASFQLTFKITVILNCAAFVWSLKQGYFDYLERWIGF